MSGKVFTIDGVSYPINPGTDSKFDKELVPSGLNYVIDEDPAHDFTKQVLTCAAFGKAALIQGPKGTGKTSSVIYLAQETNNPLTAMQMTGATGVDDFVGKWLVKEGKTYWHEGPLSVAVERGHWFLVDELNMALPEILSVLGPVLDDRKTLYLPEKGAGEVLRVHPNFRLFAAINPPEDYAGTKEMNHALIDRYLYIVVDYPKPRKEIQIIEANSLVNIDNDPSSTNIKTKEGVITRMVQVANALRTLHKEMAISFEMSTRNLIDWAGLAAYLPVKEACKMAFLNKADLVDHPTIWQEIDKLFQNDERWLPKADRKTVARRAAKAGEEEQDFQG